LRKWANAAIAPILSLDTPSGVDSTTENALGAAIYPQWTMTLALPKTGLLPEKTGQLMLAPLGIPLAVYQHPTLNLNYSFPFDHRYRVPLTLKEED
jgi:NAD(P)H-hydrate epimerase